MHQHHSVLSRGYWHAAAIETRHPRALCLAGIVCAMAIILKSFPIYLVGPTLKIYFSFVFVSIGCAVYGPIVGMMAGAVVDTLGFVFSGYGEPYFPGYLLSAILSGFVYGVMLYDKRVTVSRLLLTKLIINYGLNVLLGSVWKAMLYGKGYYYYFVSGLAKNTLLLPVEAFLMAAAFRLLPIVKKRI